MRGGFEKFQRGYKAFALLFLNAVILFLLLNGFIWLFIRDESLSVFVVDKNAISNSPFRLGALRYEFDDLRTVYPDLSDQHMIQLLMEVWNLPLVCDRDTFFREGEFSGSFVQIAPIGYRYILDQASWPPNEDAYNIFVFGGSTTFGYGEMDRKTIPSFMQRQLRSAVGEDITINVYNFGHGFYFSLQERLEFERLVMAGYKPDLAIFIDGLNEFVHWQGEPQAVNCDTAVNQFSKLSNTLSCAQGEFCWPVQRLATHLNNTLATSEPVEDEAELVSPPFDDETTNRLIVERWLENKRLIEETAVSNNIATLFVWQPHPAYEYDLEHHLFADDLADLGETARANWGYPIWKQIIDTSDESVKDNVVDLSLLVQEKQEPLFVDRVHYITSFSREISAAITNAILENSMIQLKK